MAWQAAIAPAVGAVAGYFGGGGKQDDIHPRDAIPEIVMDEWYREKVNSANLEDRTAYPGNLTTPQNDFTMNSLQGMYDYGAPGGQGNRIQNTFFNQGKQGQQAFGQGMNYLNRQALFGPAQFNQNGFDPNQYQFDQGTFDQTMQNLTPGMSGQYDAMMRDPIRQYQEQTIPGINSAAAGSGNQFGTKAFNTGAIAARGLADRGADTASNIWQNASNQANQAAYGAGSQNTNNAFNAASQGSQQDYGAGISNMQQANQFGQNMVSNYGNMASLGGNMLNSAYNMGTGNVNMQNKAGLMQNQFDQNWINGEVDRWNYEQNAPMNHLGQQLDMVNAQRSNAAPRTVGPTLMEQLYNGGQMGAGLWDTFGGMFNGAPPAPSYAPQTGWGNQEQDQLSGRYNPGSYTPMPNY